MTWRGWSVGHYRSVPSATFRADSVLIADLVGHWGGVWRAC